MGPSKYVREQKREKKTKNKTSKQNLFTVFELPGTFHTSI